MTHQESYRKRLTAGAARAVGAAALAAGLLAVPSVERPASAQALCSARAEIVRSLADRYEEAPVAAGLSEAGRVIEVFTSGSGETWSLVVTLPDGRSCLIDSGEGWQTLASRATGPEA